jgi:hypothetical protein
MDSFGFAGASQLCCGGKRRCGRLRNYPQWVSVPADEVGNFRYRELFRLRGGKIVVQDVLGYRHPLKTICADFLLHTEKPE